jgi:HAD superfamily phosphoserine phosphatase-like hydrolase
MTGKEEEIRVAVFDLNGTLYNEKSKDEFYKFICTKMPHKAGTIFQLMYYQALVKMHRINQTEFKENFFNYLDDIPPEQVTAYAAEFWRKEYPWHFHLDLKARLNQLKREGVELFCATGGLELYVKPLFDIYPVDGFAGTRVRYVDNTYLVEGEACKSEEKLRRISEHYGGRPYRIVESYSDSREDILDKADKSFLVKKGKLIPYK